MIRKDSQQAFQEAIDAGRLSANPEDANYAGHYMYMGPAIDKDISQRVTFYRDSFKHIDTRQYIA